MDKIFDNIEELNKKTNIEIKNNKKLGIHICYFCDNKIFENYLSFDLIIDEKNEYVCEKCLDGDEFIKFGYCHNCGLDIDNTSYYCTKCPEDINILCLKCHKLHNILLNSKH